MLVDLAHVLGCPFAFPSNVSVAVAKREVYLNHRMKAANSGRACTQIAYLDAGSSGRSQEQDHRA